MKLWETNLDNSTNADNVTNIVISTKPQIIAPTTYQVFCLNRKYFKDELLIFRRLWGKRANLKTGVSRKLSTSNFPKHEHFLAPDTHSNVTQKKNSFFKSILLVRNLCSTRSVTIVMQRAKYWKISTEIL